MSINLLSSNARIQVPFVKVQIGSYSFGVYSKVNRTSEKDDQGFWTAYNIQYPNYIQSLNITKINGKVNQYKLNIKYPVTQNDDPNFFEKVFSSVSGNRKIIFTYGDWSMPSYIYKDEEALITKIDTSFDINSAVINYDIEATSSSILSTSGCFTFDWGKQKKKPSDIIKNVLLKNPAYGLRSLFTGMSTEDVINELIAGDDQEVTLVAKSNISVLEYLNYLVSCMVPSSSVSNENLSSDVYILTIHDATIYDTEFTGGKSYGGPYFKITKVNNTIEKSDAYAIDIGISTSTSTIVTNFQIDNRENYSLYYQYQTEELGTQEYAHRINEKGEWYDCYAPQITSKNDTYRTRDEDKTWWTKITKYPISASITVQGLLRPATLMSYVRLNVWFPGGQKHISSGLYIVTAQTDSISGAGYRTTLKLTRVGGDEV